MHPSWKLFEVESESNKVLTGNTSTVQNILFYLPDDQWTNGKTATFHDFDRWAPTHWEVPNVISRDKSLVQDSKQLQKLKTKAYTLSPHLIESRYRFFFFNAPQTQAMQYESTEYLDPLKGRPFFVCQHFDPPLAVESIDASDEGFNELKGTIAIHGVKIHMSKLPPKHHHPKTAPNIIKT